MLKSRHGVTLGGLPPAIGAENRTNCGRYGMFGWHVAVTHPVKEFQAEENLRGQGFQPFVPKVISTKLIRNRHHTIRAPYIQGYVFINFDDTEPSWRSINSTRGIQHLMLAAPEKPATVQADAMAVLIDRCSGSDIVDAHHVDQELAKLVPIGSIIEVTDGPFEGNTAKVRWTHMDRVIVLMRFLGYTRKIDMPANSVRVARA
jgi:transcriptional antiterminator RfaH